MISFENSKNLEEQKKYAESIAIEKIRPQARYYDDHEHELPWDYVRFVWDTARKILVCLKPWAAASDEAFM